MDIILPVLILELLLSLESPLLDLQQRREKKIFFVGFTSL